RDKLKVYSSELTPLTRFNAKLNANYRFQEPLVGGQVLAELRRCFPQANYASFFSSPTTSQTTNSIYAINIGNCYAESMESGYDTTKASNQLYLEFTFTTALASASNLHVFILHDRWLTVDKNGG